MHPYSRIPAHRNWRKSVAKVALSDFDPVANFPFKIKRDDKLATAGSCFAQHMSRHLSEQGFNFLVTEPGHPVIEKEIRERHGYGVYSARYGNIYTARQLRQLYDRAFGKFKPHEHTWAARDGSYLDPFRPTVQPGGFSTQSELLSDRDQHLSAVRKMFETLDIFVFTLGLTEAWLNNEEGTVYPICPGVSGGAFDEGIHSFKNFSVDEIVEDLKYVRDAITSINPSAKIILTVSPVPLVATATDSHVVQATTLSKATLRVAAEAMQSEFENVGYFPSYEVVTSNASRGAYFAEDLRSVTEEGVQHVMKLLTRHATENGSVEASQPAPHPSAKESDFKGRLSKVVEVLCDEEAYDV